MAEHNLILENYSNINALLLEISNEKRKNMNFHMNYSYFFTSENNRNLAISGKFAYKDDFYYGISPELTTKIILDDANQGKCDNDEEFEKLINLYVSKYWNDTYNNGLFTLDERRALMARAVVIILDKLKDNSTNINEHDFRLENDDICLYNGINLRLKHIEEIDVKDSNFTNCINLLVERTTFFTTLAFTVFKKEDINENNSNEENNNIEKHNLLFNMLINYKSILDDFDKQEQNKFNVLVNELKNCNNNPLQDQNILNNYLNISRHTLYLNVSSNITSNEGYLIYGYRGKSEKDNGTLYCSANGVSEVYGQNVEYYNYSVNEDVPTIYYDQNINRIDFSKEINREIINELNISNMTNRFEYYGFLLMANYYNEKIFEPCHFNILMSTHSYEDFYDIKDHQKKAVEKSENKEIYALNMICYKCYIDALYKNILKPFAIALVNNAEMIILLFLLFTEVINTIKSDEKFSFIKIFNSLFDGTFNALIKLLALVMLFVKIITNLIDYKKDKQYIYNIRIIKPKKENAFSIYKNYYRKQITEVNVSNDAEYVGMHQIYEALVLFHYFDLIEDHSNK